MRRTARSSASSASATTCCAPSASREQRLFTALAQRAALAVQNAQHFAEEQRRAEQFRVIGEVGRGLASILDIDELLNEIVRLIQTPSGTTTSGWPSSRGMKRSTGWARASCGMTRTLRLRPTASRWVSEGITGWVAGSGEPLLAPDVSQEPRYVWLRGSSTRSELAVPLKVAGKVIGVLDAQSERLNAFDESDLTVMQSLANQAAIAIENARLYENAEPAGGPAHGAAGDQPRRGEHPGAGRAARS